MTSPNKPTSANGENCSTDEQRERYFQLSWHSNTTNAPELAGREQPRVTLPLKTGRSRSSVANRLALVLTA
jgi:hypothetical protein